jgi:hypothetical protein
MFLKSKIADFFLRVAVGMLIGVFFGWLLSEVSYAFTPYKEDAQRAPQTITLVIPYGTADQVSQGVYNPSLPDNMNFVEGDVLVVKNEDKVSHQLGPLFVPPSTSSALSLDNANDYSYTCSFEPNKYIGLTVLTRATSGVRFEGVLAIGLPTGMMLAVYSYMLPGRKKKEATAQG